MPARHVICATPANLAGTTGEQPDPDVAPQIRAVDGLLSALCGVIAGLRERVRMLEALATERGDMACSFQLVAHEAVTALHGEQAAHRRLRARHLRVLQESRQSRLSTVPRREPAA